MPARLATMIYTYHHFRLMQMSSSFKLTCAAVSGRQHRLALSKQRSHIYRCQLCLPVCSSTWLHSPARHLSLLPLLHSSIILHTSIHRIPELALLQCTSPAVADQDPYLVPCQQILKHCTRQHTQRQCRLVACPHNIIQILFHATMVWRRLRRACMILV